MTDRAGLAGDTAAGDSAHDVKFSERIGQGQRLANDELKGLKAEIIVDIAAIDRDRAGTRIKSYTRNRLFAAARAIELRFRFIHS